MLSEKARHKLKVLKFWEKHGLLATMDAFCLSRRTLYNWEQQFRSGKGKPGLLEERSKRPITVRRSLWPIAIIDEIKRLRKAYPNLGKEKVYVLLKPYCDQLGMLKKMMRKPACCSSLLLNDMKQGA